MSLSLEDEFRQIEADFKAQAGNEYAASRGEFLNGKVMAAYLGYEFVDAATVIRFDKNGNLMQTRQTNSFKNVSEMRAGSYSGILWWYGRRNCKDILQRWI